MKIRWLPLIMLFVSASIMAQDSLQTFLSVSNTGVNEFHNTFPEYDGRGTIIIILDTGVDQGIDGLTHTSTGEIKVIDVQDFTGEGDVQLYEAEIDEQDGVKYFLNEEMSYRVGGAGKLTYLPADDEYFIGAFEESRLINSSSGAADLNGNGSTDDVYYVVAFNTSADGEEFWVAYFDTNGDQKLDNELPIRNYKDDLTSLTILNDGLPELTIGLNIFPEEKRVSLHFDDGAHGTHVAGIAAGFNIGGTGLNGVAPGAYIISCKLGNNLYAGGATVTESMKQAYLYADKLSKERKEPCIINMSFGIGSEIEGRSDMEEFLAELLTNNPYLYVCTSNGNEGPGISTTGLPSASEFVLSSGAMLPKEVARDLYSTNLQRDIILYFSSRGGEAGKPDIISPGASTSTVPNWETRDRYWGTSMASPYSAGVVSLLLSAMNAEFPDIKIPSHLVFTAIRESGVKINGYSHVDQGSGYVNVMGAYNLLKKYVTNGEIKQLETYSIRSVSPNMPDGNASNLYLRNGSFLKEKEKINFIIKRNNFQDVDKFYRVYRLECEEDWLIPVQKKVYIRNNQPAVITVMFDKSKMTEPGLYSGKIKAYRNDGSNFPEFEMLATVVIPYNFSYENNYTLKWADKKIETGEVHRYFINLPAGQTSMQISATRNPSEYTMVRFHLFNPDGIEISGSSVLYSVDNENKVEEIYYNLTPGIYEVDVEGFFRAEEISQYNLAISFNSISRLDDKMIGGDDNSFTIINEFNTVQNLSLNGSIIGYEVEHSIDLKGGEHYKYPFTLNKGEALKNFTLNLTKQNFNKVTDFAILILDEDGVAVSKDGLSYSKGSISVENMSPEETTNYILELIPAFTHKDDLMKIKVIENTEFTSPVNVDVTFAGRYDLALYPNIPTDINCVFEEIKQEIPENSILYGKIIIESVSGENIVSEIPVYFNK